MYIILEYVNDKKTVIIHNNGIITDLNMNKCNNIIPKYIYEGELMEDGEIEYFDCLMYDIIKIYMNIE